MNAWLHFGFNDEPRLTVNVPVKELPLRHHKLGLPFTATGYGSKIPTVYVVQWQGRWRRVYAACFGNAASTYIGKPGQWLATVDVER
jgi:hypothetical protein